MTLSELTNRIVARTAEGPVAEWVERIATIARRAGLPMERIDWGGSPLVVAYRVAERARRYHGNLDRLALAIGDGCEHGIPDGEYCGACNAEYKRARREAGLEAEG